MLSLLSLCLLTCKWIMLYIIRISFISISLFLTQSLIILPQLELPFFIVVCRILTYKFVTGKLMMNAGFKLSWNFSLLLIFIYFYLSRLGEIVGHFLWMQFSFRLYFDWSTSVVYRGSNYESFVCAIELNHIYNLCQGNECWSSGSSRNPYFKA